MALVTDEGAIVAGGELLLGPRSLPIDLQITVEWLRGIEEPTWYGYFTPHYDLSMLPGRYTVLLDGREYFILTRRQPESSVPGAIPFWGLGEPPPVPPQDEDPPPTDLTSFPRG
jgi:hypothetical protein